MAGLQALLQQARSDALPVPPDICVPCSLPGALFSLDGGDGCDQLLGIPSRSGVGPTWHPIGAPSALTGNSAGIQINLWN